MPTSGIKTADEVRYVYTRVHNRLNKNKLPYAVFKISDDLKEIVIDHDSKFYEKELSYNDLLGQLPDDSPRYVAVDFKHKNSDGTATSTVIVISWCPKSCPMKKKFICGTTLLSLVRTLGDPKYFEGEEFSDLSAENLCSCVKDWTVIPEAELPPLSESELPIKCEEEA